ncbi:hypothetical protein BJV78DRAFT_380656 [Lactifluus subvellereus]|nr:hypothetical protein BJV78DRAFT_380656 [Lactifluus subvellereus]
MDRILARERWQLDAGRTFASSSWVMDYDTWSRFVSHCGRSECSVPTCDAESTRIWLMDLVQQRNSNLPVCRVRGLIGMLLAALVASLTVSDVPDPVIRNEGETESVTRRNVICSGGSPCRIGWRLYGTAAKVAIRVRDARRSRDRAERRGSTISYQSRTCTSVQTSSPLLRVPHHHHHPPSHFSSDQGTTRR